jgi:hypothetical protein
MYSNINSGWPIDSWELTEPSLGYQTYYIRLISNFVQEKGVDIGEKIDTESSSSSAANTAESSSATNSSSSSKDKSESLMISGPVITNVHFVRNAILVNVSRESVVHIQIFDMQGNKVESIQERVLGNKRISLDALSQGYYIARITNGNAAKSIPIAIR